MTSSKINGLTQGCLIFFLLVNLIVYAGEGPTPELREADELVYEASFLEGEEKYNKLIAALYIYEQLWNTSHFSEGFNWNILEEIIKTKPHEKISQGYFINFCSDVEGLRIIYCFDKHNLIDYSEDDIAPLLGTILKRAALFEYKRKEYFREAFEEMAKSDYYWIMTRYIEKYQSLAINIILSSAKRKLPIGAFSTKHYQINKEDLFQMCHILKCDALTKVLTENNIISEKKTKVSYALSEKRTKE